MIHVDTLPINPWQENTYILSDETGECVIIDPGCLSESEQQSIVDFIKNKNLKPVKLLQTHLHLDHVFGSRFIANTYNLKMEAHAGDEFFIEQTMSYAQQFGVQVKANPPAISTYLNDGDVITFGHSTLKVMHLPGHSQGGIAFYNEDDKLAIVGDSIFRESIGRTDLPGGDYDTLISSLKDKLLKLSDDVRIYPGHGPSSTIGFERKHNSFLQN